MTTVGTTVGFIGLGSMGMPMACNLLARGFDLRGFDVRRESVAALEARGGRGADSAAAAAEGADALVLMVVNAAQADSVLFAQGALDRLPDGATVILMATCPPDAVAALAARVEAAGRRFVDAPVSGGTVGAVAGTLSIMAAAPAATVERVRPVLAAMGDKVFHVGEAPGQGATVKTVNQLLCGVHIAVVAEAFSLAAKAGVDLAVLLEIMSGSAASSWMLKDRGPRMLEAEPGVTSAVDIFVKDLGIVLEAGRGAKAALPLAAVAHQMFLSASGRGEGAMDDSQVIRSYHLLNGVAPG
ncbi:oxidoreductase (plasmid) [Azospirillum sp. TSH58]|uniref:NAD(P)-dependent oxidoreductase n=1 Tax=Azospirillum sp. TSH58 TaxID=664962 RepID=UPI000D5FE62A|nr:NAD(P)-dependent oxidoreductase [Azospirillum sp. TSH58]AWJ87918.1 oxidoreductase [Azospirillum sp. TSH58]PWC66366.1 oxidoreductase [Azospirillum sp. TSH58]